MLYELPIRRESIEEAKQILAVPQVGRALKPGGTLDPKAAGDRRLFPEDMRIFEGSLPVSENRQIGIFCAYDPLLKQTELRAVLGMSRLLWRSKKKDHRILKRKFHVQAEPELEEEKAWQAALC